MGTPQQHRVWLVAAIAAADLLAGCESMSGAARHGWEGADYENTYLSTSSPLGARALENWHDFDIDVREFLDTHRKPDVIYSKAMEVTFFYLRDNLQVHFDRPAVGFSTKKEVSAIPDALAGQLHNLFQ